MKITTWNVNSINARLEHLIKFIKYDKSDIYLIQELKCTNENFPLNEIKKLGYNSYINGQKAWNGVAILSLKELEILNNKIPGFEKDESSRILETQIYIKKINKKVRLFCIYLPNGNPIETEKFDYKIKWMQKLNSYIFTLLEKNESIIIGGDFNVIPSDNDVYEPENFKNDACAHPKTREQYRLLINAGFTDVVKDLMDGSTNWTFWGYRGGSWQKGNGLRIDHFLTSWDLNDSITNINIDRKPRSWDKASDHTPVTLELKK